jgi:hypothetical protein
MREEKGGRTQASTLDLAKTGCISRFRHAAEPARHGTFLRESPGLDCG